MSRSTHPSIRRLLHQYHDGLTAVDIAERLDLKQDSVRNALKNMPDTYIRPSHRSQTQGEKRMTIAWYDPTNHHVSTDKNDPLFTPLGQLWPLGVEANPDFGFGNQPEMVGGMNQDDWKDIVTAISKVRDSRGIYLACRPADVFQDWFLALCTFKLKEKNSG